MIKVGSEFKVVDVMHQPGRLLSEGSMGVAPYERLGRIEGELQVVGGIGANSVLPKDK